MTEIQTQGTKQGRHAMVVPSFIAELVTKRLECWIGTVEPAELLDWRRPSDLTGKARQELRQQIIKRIRPRMAQIWPMKPGFDPPPDWQDYATARERRLINAVQSAGRALSTCSLQEIKELVHMPLESLFSALAILEAPHWIAPIKSPRPEMKSTARDPCKINDELRGQVEQALALPWIDAVTSTDLRFAYPSEDKLSSWLRSQLSSPQGWYGLPGLIQHMLRADGATARQEIDEVARACAATYYRRRTPHDKVDAKLNIFERRYVRAHGEALTLQEVANETGITRERVRQICDQIVEPWRAGKPVTPAIDRVFRMAARLAPAGLPELNDQLAPRLGEGLSLESLCSLAQDLELPIAITLHHGTVNMRQDSIPIRMVSKATDGATWIEDAIRFARIECDLVGCSSVVRIAGLLALESGVAMAKSTIEAVISNIPGFRWLDHASSWFTLRSSQDSAAASRIMKLFYVATESVSVEEIGAALLDDEDWLQRGEKHAPAIPPQHILRDLLAGWDWLEQLQHTRFALRTPLSPEVLNGTELLAVQAIEALGGIALRREVLDFIASRSDISEIAISFMLARSPAIKRLEKNVYGLRGRPIPLQALEAARNRNVPARVEVACGPGVLAACRVNVTPASLINEQYGIPTHIRRTLESGTYQLDGRPGQLTIGQGHVIRGLNRMFPDAQAGDTFGIELLEEGTLRISHYAAEKDPDSEQEASLDDHASSTPNEAPHRSAMSQARI